MHEEPHEGPGQYLQLPEELFDLGHVVATPGAADALERNSADPAEYVLRHVWGFWGDIEPEDRTANEVALVHGGRIISTYTLKDETKIWVITEWDRSMTTVLLPSEY